MIILHSDIALSIKKYIKNILVLQKYLTNDETKMKFHHRDPSFSVKNSLKHF